MFQAVTIRRFLFRIGIDPRKKHNCRVHGLGRSGDGQSERDIDVTRNRVFKTARAIVAPGSVTSLHCGATTLTPGMEWTLHSASSPGPTPPGAVRRLSRWR